MARCDQGRAPPGNEEARRGAATPAEPNFKSNGNTSTHSRTGSRRQAKRPTASAIRVGMQLYAPGLRERP